MTNITKVQHKKDKTLKQSYQKASLKGWVLTALWKRPLSSQISSSERESSRFCCKGFSDLLGTYGYESSVIYADACPCRAIKVKTWISKWTLKFIGNNWLVCEYLKDLGKHLNTTEPTEQPQAVQPDSPASLELPSLHEPKSVGPTPSASQELELVDPAPSVSLEPESVGRIL